MRKMVTAQHVFDFDSFHLPSPVSAQSPQKYFCFFKIYYEFYKSISIQFQPNDTQTHAARCMLMSQ